MLKNLLNLPKRYMQLLLLRIILAVVITTALGVTTLIMAGVMLFIWNIEVAITLAVCLGPWLLAILVLIMMLRKKARCLILFS